MSVRAIPSYRQKRETTRAERAAAKVLNNQLILEIYHRNSGLYFAPILSSGDESDDATWASVGTRNPQHKETWPANSRTQVPVRLPRVDNRGSLSAGSPLRSLPCGLDDRANSVRERFTTELITDFRYRPSLL